MILRASPLQKQKESNMAWADTRANVTVAGIASWKVRDTGKTEDFSLPFLRVNVKSISQKVKYNVV